MDFSILFQMRNKKYWWIDIIFYLAISLLIATIFSYIIFIVKNGMISSQIKEEEIKTQEVAKNFQKEHEKEVIAYQKKINDFETLLKNHEFASNIFSFMQAQTMPNVWFSQFGLDRKNRSVQLSGIADNMDAVSRQVDVLENDKHIKSIGSFTSSLGESARINFNLTLSLEDNIFVYLADISPSFFVSEPEVTVSSEEEKAEAEQASSTPEETSNQEITSDQIEKMITSFVIFADPEIVGEIDQQNYLINLAVPFGTDVTKLVPKITFSPDTTIQPENFVPQDFTNPVIYKITAQDGSTQNYQVIVNIAPPPPPEKSNTAIKIIIITSVIAAIMVVIVAVLVFIKRRKNQNQPNNFVKT